MPQHQHTLFIKLEQIIDSLREKSFYSQDKEHQKRFLGLSVRQATALRTISVLTKEQPQGIPLKTLAARLQMTIPAASLLVESMVNKGFFDRSTNPNDRRSICIKLSAKGQKNFKEICTTMDQFTEELILTLPEQDRKDFERIVEQLFQTVFQTKP